MKQGILFLFVFVGRKNINFKSENWEVLYIAITLIYSQTSNIHSLNKSALGLSIYAVATINLKGRKEKPRRGKCLSLVFYMLSSSAR